MARLSKKETAIEKQKLDMDQSITTKSSELKKPLVKKVPKVTDGALQPGGTLALKLNYDKPHWNNPVTGSVLACQLCQWESGWRLIANIQIIFFAISTFVLNALHFFT